MLAGSLGRGIGRGSGVNRGGINRSRGVGYGSRSAGRDRSRCTSGLLVEQTAEARLLRSRSTGDGSGLANGCRCASDRSRFAGRSRSAGSLLVEQAAEARLLRSRGTRRGGRAGGDRLNVNHLRSRSCARGGASLLGMTTGDRAHYGGDGETDHDRETPCQWCWLPPMWQKPHRKYCPSLTVP